jgi:hypothetical protein
LGETHARLYATKTHRTREEKRRLSRPQDPRPTPGETDIQVRMEGAMVVGGCEAWMGCGWVLARVPFPPAA